jgi:hypothetical protein
LQTSKPQGKTLSGPADFAIAQDADKGHANRKIKDRSFRKTDDREHEFAAQAVDSADVPFSRTCVALTGYAG